MTKAEEEAEWQRLLALYDKLSEVTTGPKAKGPTRVESALYAMAMLMADVVDAVDCYSCRRKLTTDAVRMLCDTLDNAESTRDDEGDEGEGDEVEPDKAEPRPDSEQPHLH
jgi:hypothetical protein